MTEHSLPRLRPEREAEIHSMFANALWYGRDGDGWFNSDLVEIAVDDLETEIAALRTELRGHEQLLKVTEGAFERLLTEARADVDAANARAAAAERERDALMQAARNVIAWDDKSSGNYTGAWEIVADADKLNALNALLYPATAQTADGSAAE